MKRWLLVGGLVLALCGSAQGRPLGCFVSHQIQGDEAWPCSVDLMARHKRQSFVALGGDWTLMASAWQASDGTIFLTGYQPPRMFGRYQNLRVLERIIYSGPHDPKRLIVSYRSVGSPQPVTFSWQVLAR